MDRLKILTSHHVLPNVKSINTLFFENLLPVLQTKIKIQMIWLVYQPDKLNLSQQKDSDDIILDIHNYKNAVELMEKEKPDIIFAYADSGIIDYALSLAGKFLNIPVVSGFHTYPDQKFRRRTTILKSIIIRSFDSSIPTDTSTSKKGFMRRGRFFIYKYIFLLRTQRAINMDVLKIIKNFLHLVREYTDQTKIYYDSRFANTLHWLEGESLIEPLVNAGFQKSTLVLTGSPMYDTAFQKLQNYKPSLRKDNKTHVLLVTTSLYEHGFWTRKQRDTVTKEIVTKIHEHKDEVSLIVKIHPSSEVLSDYQSIINPIDPSIPIYQKGSILEFLDDVDVVLSFASGNASAMIYALIARKTIIICNFYNLKDDLFLERGLALECKEPAEIISSIRKVISSNPASNEKVEEFVREFLYKSDGHASERISDAIMTLVEK